jgi:hypothetical protein
MTKDNPTKQLETHFRRLLIAAMEREDFDEAEEIARRSPTLDSLAFVRDWKTRKKRKPLEKIQKSVGNFSTIGDIHGRETITANGDREWT